MQPPLSQGQDFMETTIFCYFLDNVEGVKPKNFHDKKRDIFVTVNAITTLLFGEHHLKFLGLQANMFFTP